MLRTIRFRVAVQRKWWKRLGIIGEPILVMVIAAGLLARAVALPTYVPESGDEWGNTIAPLRALIEHGNPGTFIHPSLYYYVIAPVYLAVYSAVRATGIMQGPLSMTDVLVRDERYFVFAARGVSVLSAALAMCALYALGTLLWHRSAGLLAAALLAVSPQHALHSEAVRVDSLFVAVFVYAFYRIVRAIDAPDRRTLDIASVATGLAVGANYNGAVLIPWLIAAQWLRPDVRTIAGASPPVTTPTRLSRALTLAALAFVASSPFVLLDFETSLRHFAFQSGLSLVANPGTEARGTLFYAEALARSYPSLAALIAASCVVVALVGNRTERFVLSLPLGYFVLFSLVRTKYDRFMLPAMALFLLVAAGLPFVLARRFRPRALAVAPVAVSCALLVICLATLAPQSIPVPNNPMLLRPDPPLFDWMERNVAPQSNVLIESGIAPLIDTLEEPGRLAAELRQSLVAIRPNLDQHFIGAVYVGGRSNYDPGVFTDKRIDYAIITSRTARYIESRCETFPDVCAFYRDLRANGRFVFETPPGFERAIIYDVRRQ